MKTLLFGLLISSYAFAADFPLNEYRAMEMKAKVLILGDDLSKAGGRGEKFDAAQALQACDDIDKNRLSQFKGFVERRTEALNEATNGSSGWEDRLKAKWNWDKNDTLSQAISKQNQKWKELAKVALPCKDETSLELIDNVANDQNAADDPPFSLCVRMIKALRKSAECGRPPFSTIVPST